MSAVEPLRPEDTPTGTDAPLASASLRLKAYKALKAAISEMDIYGQETEIRLDEAELSRRLGVSRTPVREARALLEQEGLLRTTPWRGIYVVRKSRREIIQMIVAWAAIESMAVRLVVEHASDSELDALLAMARSLEAPPREGATQDYSDANIAFHQAFIQRSGNRMLMELAESLFVHVRAIRSASMRQGERATRSAHEHRLILEAIAARDGPTASALVRDHALGLAEHVRRHGLFPDQD